MITNRRLSCGMYICNAVAILAQAWPVPFATYVSTSFARLAWNSLSLDPEIRGYAVPSDGDPKPCLAIDYRLVLSTGRRVVTVVTV